MYFVLFHKIHNNNNFWLFNYYLCMNVMVLNKIMPMDITV